MTLLAEHAHELFKGWGVGMWALFVVEADCCDADGRTGGEDVGQARDAREGAGSVDDQNGPPSRPAFRIELPIGPAFVDEAQQPGYQGRPIVSCARHSSTSGAGRSS